MNLQFVFLFFFGLLLVATALAAWRAYRRTEKRSRARVRGRVQDFVVPREFHINPALAPIYGDRSLPAYKLEGRSQQAEAYDRYMVSDECDYTKPLSIAWEGKVNEPSLDDDVYWARFREWQDGQGKGA